MKRQHLMTVTGLGLLLAMGNPLASERLDHDAISQGRTSGAMLSMEQAMNGASAKQPGEIVEIELERDDGAYRYEIKILAADGTIHKLYLDAASGDLIKRKQK